MTPLFGLTERQQEILLLMVDEGLTSKEVAYALGLSSRTVDTHVDRAIEKIGARNRASALLQVDRARREQKQLEKQKAIELEALAARAGRVHCPTCGGFGFVRRTA